MATTMTKRRWALSDADVRKVIDDYKAHPDKMQKDIATEIGCCPATVCTLIKEFESGNKRTVKRYNNGGISSYKGSGHALHTSDDPLKRPDTLHVVRPKSTEKANVTGKAPTMSISPGKHAAIPHKLSVVYKNLDRQELAFLKAAKKSHDFITSYFKHFGFDLKTSSKLNEVWKRREDILKYEDEKLHHAIEKPKLKNIVEPRKEREREAMVDDDRLLTTICSNVTLLMNMQTENRRLQESIAASLGIEIPEPI